MALDVQDIHKLENLVPELPPAFQEVYKDFCQFGKDCCNYYAYTTLAASDTFLLMP